MDRKNHVWANYFICGFEILSLCFFSPKATQIEMILTPDPEVALGASHHLRLRI